MIRLTRYSVLAVLLALAPVAFAADSAAEIALQRALDTPLENLKLDKVELSKAFEDIAAEGKVALQVDPACYDLLPYGATTKVSATFRQSKLRDSLDEILRPLALDKSISGATIIISPTPPLARVGRRATWEELNVLQKARTEILPQLNDIRWTTDLRPILGVDSLTVENALPPGGPNDAALDQVKRQLPSTVWKALDTYTAATGQVWFVNGNALKIMSSRQWIEQQLGKPVEIHKTNRPLAEITSELSHLSGIHFSPDPGLYAAFPSVTLNSTNGTVRQVLDTLKGTIGITWDTHDDAIAIGQAKSQPTTQPRLDAIVGQIIVPISAGNSFTMFVRESDLPAELAELRKRKIHEAVEGIQKALTPTSDSAPATTPATQGNK